MSEDVGSASTPAALEASVAGPSSADASAKGKGKAGGKGKAPPPPPTGQAKAREEHEAKKKEQQEREKREALEKIEKQKAREAAQRAVIERLPFLSPLDINHVNWEEGKAGVHLPGGAGTDDSGVWIAEFEGDRALVLRDQRLLFSTELVADHVASALRVPIARHRLLHPEVHKEEFAAFEAARPRVKESHFDYLSADHREKFAQYVESLRLTDVEQYEKELWHLEHGMRHGSIAIHEFVQGHSMDVAVVQLEAADENACLVLGRMCAFDIVLNNFDRLPMPLWDNHGNLTNVMFRPSGEVVGIDQQVSREGASAEVHLARTRCLVQALFGRAVDAEAEGGAPDMSPEAVTAKWRGDIAGKTGVTLTDAQLATMLEGLRSGLRDAATSWESGTLRAALDAAVTEAGHIDIPEAHRVRAGLIVPKDEAQQDADWVMTVAGEIAGVLRG